jgi:hypothetical protein
MKQTQQGLGSEPPHDSRRKTNECKPNERGVYLKYLIHLILRQTYILE